MTEAWTLRLLQPPQGSWLPGAMGVTRRLATQIDSRCLAWLGAATKEAWDTLRERGQACKDAGEVPAGQAPRKAAAVGEAEAQRGGPPSASVRKGLERLRGPAEPLARGEEPGQPQLPHPVGTAEGKPYCPLKVGGSVRGPEKRGGRGSVSHVWAGAGFRGSLGN